MEKIFFRVLRIVGGVLSFFLAAYGLIDLPDQTEKWKTIAIDLINQMDAHQNAERWVFVVTGLAGITLSIFWPRIKSIWHKVFLKKELESLKQTKSILSQQENQEQRDRQVRILAELALNGQLIDHPVVQIVVNAITPIRENMSKIRNEQLQGKKKVDGDWIYQTVNAWHDSLENIERQYKKKSL